MSGKINTSICCECGKKIYGIAKVTLTLGIEVPRFLHSVCYERLKKIEILYKEKK